MKPPICEYCGRDFRDDMDGGGTVSFQLTAEDRAYNKRLQDTHMVGHPAGLFWFCSQHYAIAQRWEHLSWAEARKKMGEEVSFRDRLKAWWQKSIKN
jgi:hypothetical protein